MDRTSHPPEKQTRSLSAIPGSQRARIRSAVIRDPRFVYLELIAMALLATCLWMAIR